MSKNAIKDIARHIEYTSGIGEPHLSGRRITVAQVVQRYYQDQLSPEHIAELYDLEPAAVFAALAYYQDYSMEIDQIIAEIEALSNQGWEEQQLDPKVKKIKKRIERERERRTNNLSRAMP